MAEEQPAVPQLAEHVVVSLAAGLAGYLGPGVGALAAGAAPPPVAASGVDAEMAARQLTRTVGFAFCSSIMNSRKSSSRHGVLMTPYE